MKFSIVISSTIRVQEKQKIYIIINPFTDKHANVRPYRLKIEKHYYY